MTGLPAAPRIGSLCSGYGGLDMATQSVFGGSVAWHCQYDPDDKHQYAAQILARHWPDIPNHGDITAVDWAAVEPVDILTAGFPCQDVSLAGLRAGIADGTRSGLWLHVARAIRELRPRLVVIENVRGLLSSQAHSDVEPCPWCVGGAGGEPPLRALGAVLGDLAGLGFDAEWAVVRASEVGAPHQRERVFLLAWPAAADADDLGGAGAGRPGREPQRHPAGEDREPADAAGEGLEGGREGRAARECAATEDADRATRGEWRIAAPGQAEVGRARPDAGGRSRVPDARRSGSEAPADAEVQRRGPGRLPLGTGATLPDAGVSSEPPTDTASVGHGHAGPTGERGMAPAAVASGASATADAQGVGRGEGWPESAGQQGGSDAPLSGAPAWGDYEPAIRRWEHTIGRPAPWPTDDRGRLSPAFVEWLMGLNSGHVTGVPGLTRAAQLKALGNGVVPQQAQAAIRLLLHRS